MMTNLEDKVEAFRGELIHSAKIIHTMTAKLDRTVEALAMIANNPNRDLPSAHLANIKLATSALEDLADIETYHARKGNKKIRVKLEDL